MVLQENYVINFVSHCIYPNLQAIPDDPPGQIWVHPQRVMIIDGQIKCPPKLSAVNAFMVYFRILETPLAASPLAFRFKFTDLITGIRNVAIGQANFGESAILKYSESSVSQRLMAYYNFDSIVFSK